MADVLVVGGGSAGCVLAARLCRSTSLENMRGIWRVLSRHNFRPKTRLSPLSWRKAPSRSSPCSPSSRLAAPSCRSAPASRTSVSKPSCPRRAFVSRSRKRVCVATAAGGKGSTSSRSILRANRTRGDLGRRLGRPGWHGPGPHRRSRSPQQDSHREGRGCPDVFGPVGVPPHWAAPHSADVCGQCGRSSRR